MRKSDNDLGVAHPMVARDEDAETKVYLKVEDKDLQSWIDGLADENEALMKAQELSQWRLRHLEKTIGTILEAERAYVLIREDGRRFIFGNNAEAMAAHSTLKGSQVVCLDCVERRGPK